VRRDFRMVSVLMTPTGINLVDHSS
jgi:hypothetical protein